MRGRRPFLSAAWMEGVNLNTEVNVAPLMFEVYWWMVVGLSLTAVVSLFMANNPNLIINMYQSGIMWILVALEFGFVFILSGAVHTLKASTAKALFIVYSLLNGLTLSPIFFVYAKTSIATTFFITAGMFAAAAAYGYFTKEDLSKWGSILMMTLVGVLLGVLVNFILRNEMLDYVVSIVAVVLFTFLVAWDTFKMRALYIRLSNIHGEMDPDSNLVQKVAILGALALYLDFINLFLFLLRLLASRRD